MSSPQTHAYVKPREAAPAYRCRDNHWHFIPRHNDDSRDPMLFPWYLQKVPFHAGKYQDGFHPVYIQGFGSAKFTVGGKYVSGFYYLRERPEEIGLCPGRYRRDEKKLWREEELSDTPWPRKQGTAPPTDEKPRTHGEEEESSSSSSSRHPKT